MHEDGVPDRWHPSQPSGPKMGRQLGTGGVVIKDGVTCMKYLYVLNLTLYKKHPVKPFPI